MAAQRDTGSKITYVPDTRSRHGRVEQPANLFRNAKITQVFTVPLFDQAGSLHILLVCDTDHDRIFQCKVSLRSLPRPRLRRRSIQQGKLIVHWMIFIRKTSTNLSATVQSRQTYEAIRECCYLIEDIPPEKWMCV